MRNRILIVATLAFLAGAVASPHLQWPQSQTAYAAGSQTTYTITLQSDKDFLLDNELVPKELARRAANVASHNASAVRWTTARDAIAARARSGLVKHRPALESLVPATLTDIALGYTDTDGNGRRDAGENDVVRMWLNGDADDLHTGVSSPPAGIVVGP